MSVTTDKPQVSRDAMIDTLLADGASRDEIFAAIGARSEARNRAAQADIPAPRVQTDEDFDTRRAWLLDGHPIYGELQTFYYPALAALRAGDQIEYSRARDLMFKAMRTFLGDGPPAPDPAPNEAVPAGTENSEQVPA